MPPPEEQARIREFVQALNEEIAAIRGSGRNVTVYDGRFKRREGPFFVYVFTTESPLVVVDDAPAKIEIGGEQFDGQVVSVQGSEVAVGIEHDFGEAELIREAKLIIDLSFLLEALRSRYQEVLNGQRELDTRLAQRLFGSAPVTSGIDRDELYLPPSTHAPNDDQITAIRAACGSDIHFIWGPPGTGKTSHAIGFLIAVLLRRNLRVLVVAHTNIATDNAIDSAAELLEGTVDYQSGKLVRFGNISPNFDLPEMVVLEKITDRLGQQLKEQISRQQAKLAQIRSEIDDMRRAVTLLAQLEEVRKEITSLQASFHRCIQEHENLKAQESQLVRELKDAEVKLAEAKVAGRLRRFYRGLDPVKLQSRVSRLQSDLNADRRILWEGSLNILSRSEWREDETQEHMWRHGSWGKPATKTCEDLIKLHKLA